MLKTWGVACGWSRTCRSLGPTLIFGAVGRITCIHSWPSFVQSLQPPLSYQEQYEERFEAVDSCVNRSRLLPGYAFTTSGQICYQKHRYPLASFILPILLADRFHSSLTCLLTSFMPRVFEESKKARHIKDDTTNGARSNNDKGENALARAVEEQ